MVYTKCNIGLLVVISVLLFLSVINMQIVYAHNDSDSDSDSDSDYEQSLSFSDLREPIAQNIDDDSRKGEKDYSIRYFCSIAYCCSKQCLLDYVKCFDMFCECCNCDDCDNGSHPSSEELLAKSMKFLRL